MTEPSRGEPAWDRAFARLSETLGRDGWRVYRSRRGIKARWGWLSVGLKRREKKQPETPWRARMRDGFPRRVITEHCAADPLDALEPVITRARDAARFCDGRLGLARNPSGSWLGHRLWQATRPSDPGPSSEPPRAPPRRDPDPHED